MSINSSYCNISQSKIDSSRGVPWTEPRTLDFVQQASVQQFNKKNIHVQQKTCLPTTIMMRGVFLYWDAPRKLVNKKNTTKPEWQNQLQSSCSMVFLQGFLEFSLSITIPRYCIPAKNIHNISGLVLAIHPQIQTPSLSCDHLVGGFSPPLWKMIDFVNGKDDIPYMKWKIKKWLKPSTSHGSD